MEKKNKLFAYELTVSLIRFPTQIWSKLNSYFTSGRLNIDPLGSARAT